jgi:hypothetical protein
MLLAKPRRTRSNRSRRALLGGLGSLWLAGLAGCTGPAESRRGATDVFVHNDADVARTVDLTVAPRDGESARFHTRLELRPADRPKINNDVIMGRAYDITVSFTDSTRAAPYEETQEWTDAGQPLHVMLTDQIVFAVQIG